MILALSLANKATDEPYQNFENRMDMSRAYMFGKECVMFEAP
jgi:hypothetical protein